MKEYLEKNYSTQAVKTTDDTIKLAIKALLEVNLLFYIDVNVYICQDS